MSKKLPGTTLQRLILLYLTVGLFGCNNLPNIANNSSTTNIESDVVNRNLPKVVATTSVLCSLAKQIAGDTINLTCLIPTKSDPHLYQPKPEDREAIEQAKLILYNGYNLEPGLIRIIRASKNRAAKIAVAQVAVPQPQQVKENGRTIPDPHIWHNVKNASIMVDVISSNLRKLQPNNVVIYNNNSKKTKSELVQLDSWIKLRITSIPENQRKLITTHDAMGYYAKAYGFSIAGALQGTNTREKPTNARINALFKGIQQAKIRTIFAETTVNSNLIEGVAKEAKVRVSERKLYTEGLGEPRSGADTYQKMMAANTRTIVEGLGGTYLIFQPKASKK
ncbi:MAG: zinc ABC transporter substrate-binding protein [Cyanomargarita calcarea GSE-NOS-MK-12-04C]|jgi:manganese/iron transport system substrate-binding protein|uniref:Zinc ABC transporter substrate-binding protein n=1 Tax=Cyanomargarita calcarea GSE-NOS-MK-12-04C TaxID=2839659 RepID=A0A951URD3_9CYAN|nr:zinc ABC transporter substrate-binding protein [Cyanomargarita calcarea GSE-NOS-MK-12-04C]